MHAESDIMKFFIKYSMNLKELLCNGEASCYFFLLNSRPSDLITTLTYILMDNFLPCFEKMNGKSKKCKARNLTYIQPL